VLGSLNLEPFTSKILVDNGLAPLVLTSIQPSLYDVTEAADFTLTVDGVGFTTDSVVRWSGSDRPTTFVSSTRLTAAIYAADVSTIGDFPVTVFDPLPAPDGTETSARILRVVAALFDIHLPLVRK